MASTTTAALLATITKNTNAIETYLQSKGLSPLSFDDRSQLDLLEYPPEIETARMAVIAATRELNELVEGPRDAILMGQNAMIAKSAVTRFIYQFKVYEFVPDEGHISYHDLAAATGLGLSPLRQMLRAAVSFRLFREDTPGYISHSAGTRLLRDSPVIQDWVGFAYDESVPALMGIVDALVKNPQADDPSTSGYIVAHNVQEASFYDHISKDAEKSRRFAGTMSATQTGPAYSPVHVIDNFDWTALGSATAVDVGGSTGDLAIEIAKAAPDLKLIVQDLPAVIATEKPGKHANVSFMAHDFFKEQPVRNADVYFLRWILHNWPDSYAVRILRNLTPALKPGARVLIIDEIIPSSGSLPLLMERTQRMMDLGMLSILNAKLRQLDEWEEMIRTADDRFHIASVIHPEGANLSLIELVWQPVPALPTEGLSPNL